jgi:hypothetical protein
MEGRFLKKERSEKFLRMRKEATKAKGAMFLFAIRER